MANQWRQASQQLEEVGRAASSTVQRALDGQQGVASEALGKYWETRFTATSDSAPGYFPGGVQGCEGMAEMLESMANSIETAKIQIIAQIAILAVEIATAEAEAPFTFGASLAQIPIEIGITRTVVQQLLKQLLKEALKHAVKQAAIMGGINLLAQTIEIAEGHRKSLDFKELGQAVEGGAVAGAVGAGLGRGVGALGNKVGLGRAMNTLPGKVATGAAVGVGTDVGTQLITTGKVDSDSLLGSGLSGGAGAGLHAGASAFKGHFAPPGGTNLPHTEGMSTTGAGEIPGAGTTSGTSSSGTSGSGRPVFSDAADAGSQSTFRGLGTDPATSSIDGAGSSSGPTGLVPFGSKTADYSGSTSAATGNGTVSSSFGAGSDGLYGSRGFTTDSADVPSATTADHSADISRGTAQGSAPNFSPDSLAGTATEGTTVRPGDTPGRSDDIPAGTSDTPAQMDRSTPHSDPVPGRAEDASVRTSDTPAQMDRSTPHSDPVPGRAEDASVRTSDTPARTDPSPSQTAHGSHPDPAPAHAATGSRGTGESTPAPTYVRSTPPESFSPAAHSGPAVSSSAHGSAASTPHISDPGGLKLDTSGLSTTPPATSSSPSAPSSTSASSPSSPSFEGTAGSGAGSRDAPVNSDPNTSGFSPAAGGAPTASPAPSAAAAPAPGAVRPMAPAASPAPSASPPSMFGAGSGLGRSSTPPSAPPPGAVGGSGAAMPHGPAGPTPSAPSPSASTPSGAAAPATAHPTSAGGGVSGIGVVGLRGPGASSGGAPRSGGGSRTDLEEQRRQERQEELNRLAGSGQVRGAVRDLGGEQRFVATKPPKAEELVRDLPSMSAQDRAQSLENLSPENRRWLAKDPAFVDALHDTLPPREFARTGAQLLVDVHEGAERPASARQEAQAQISRMLQDPDTTARLLKNGSRVVVIPKDTPMPDVRPFHDLRGTTAVGEAGGGRSWDDVRGSGGRHTAITEENLLGEDTSVGSSKHYTDGYSTTTHEFAHTLHRYGLSQGHQDAITDSYNNRRAQGDAAPWPDGPFTTTGPDGKPVENYSARNEDEYFAQVTNAYLGTNHGNDPHTGQPRNNGPEWVRNNAPELLPVLERLYGADPTAVHDTPANPVEATRAENDSYEGLRDFNQLTDPAPAPAATPAGSHTPTPDATPAATAHTSPPPGTTAAPAEGSHPQPSHEAPAGPPAPSPHGTSHGTIPAGEPRAQSPRDVPEAPPAPAAGATRPDGTAPRDTPHPPPPAEVPVSREEQQRFNAFSDELKDMVVRPDPDPGALGDRIGRFLEGVDPKTRDTWVRNTREVIDKLPDYYDDKSVNAAHHALNAHAATGRPWPTPARCT
ncbi:hypothetical protein [Peterkaempfera sp. SMS 1(5)a]|uniref:WXG100-like domain-containing protein n=1 Tax=Peterkaempfera podocarpi TaxID=3232308 RepID=UPI0036710972